MRNKRLSKILLILLIIGLIVAYMWFGLGRYLSLEALKAHREMLHTYYLHHQFLVGGVYMLIYIVSTALSLPGATILTLAGGAIFGLWVGVVLVSFASTIGATLAFLGSRFLFREAVQNRFREKLASINRGVEKEGAFYLFTLRLLPIFPFFLINLLMGLTPIGVGTFFVVSQVGMLPGTAVYVNAGTQLAGLTSLRGILSLNLLLSFVLIGILPLLSKWIIGTLKRRRQLRRFRRPKRYDYNMVVIGGGAAGLVSAYIAAAVKAKVALIEKHKMGGDCLNTGCVPSKAIIRSARAVSEIRRAHEFGLKSGAMEVDFAAVMERVQTVIKKIEPHDSVERYTGLGVECISGEARVISPFEVEVNGRRLTTKNIIIATGASPTVPNLSGLKESGFLTSETVWNLQALPKNLVVLGGGPIGCELAQSFARLGSKVTLVEMAPRILPREDAEVSELIRQNLSAEGIAILTSHKAVRVEGKTLISADGTQEFKTPFDQILLALGRTARTKGFGLEELGVELSDRGTVATDEFLRTTNFPNILACGDVAGPYQFTHVASHQAWYASVNALFSPLKKYKADYRVIPWCTFTDPEVARVGLSEDEAKAKGIEYQVTRYDLEDLDRAITEEEAHGFIKVLTPPKSDKILGVTLVGDHAGDVIAEYVLAMRHGLGLNKILGTIHIYPTLAEANKYAAGAWKKQNAPKAALRWLEKFHSWRRSTL